MAKKKAGRPEQFPIKKVVGFELSMMAAIEAWRRKQRPMVANVSEAIRQLIELGLKNS